MSAKDDGVRSFIAQYGLLGGLRTLAWGTGKSGVGLRTINRHRYTDKITPTFQTMMERLLSESRIRCAIDELGDISVGGGFHTTCAEGHEKAKDVVDNFCEDADLDYLNLMWSKELWALGNALPWLRIPTQLTTVYRVPMTTITRIRADRFGRVTEFTQDTKGESAYKVKGTELNQLRLWSYNPIEDGLLGVGLMHTYVVQGAGYRYKDSDNTWKVAYRPSLAEINEEMEDMMRVTITRGAPKFIIELAGFDDIEADSVETAFNKGSWVDDVIVNYNNKDDKELTPHRLVTDVRTRLPPYIEHFKDKEMITMQTPSVKLISETGFTEASSRTAERIEMRKVSAFQRFLKRRLERDIFKAVLVSKLDYSYGQIKEANVRMHWGEETKPELTFEALHNAYVTQGITLDEYRNNVAKFGMELTTEGLKDLKDEKEERKREAEERNTGKDTE